MTLSTEQVALENESQDGPAGDGEPIQSDGFGQEPEDMLNMQMANPLQDVKLEVEI